MDVALDAMEADEVLPAHVPLQTLTAVGGYIQHLAAQGAKLYQIRDAANAVVARVRLPRDALRLGEVVDVLIDFDHAVQPTYKVSAFLETYEAVTEVFRNRDPDITTRATRQVRPARPARIGRLALREKLT